MTMCRAPHVAGDGDRHDADGPGAGDEHVLADQVEGEGGVRGVAERIEDRGDLVVDGRRQLEHVRRRDGRYSAKRRGG